MASGQSDVSAKRLGVVQADLASGSTSDLGTLLDKFWSSWDTLAANPTSTDAKAAVVGTAQTLAQRFATLDADIASAGTQATAAVSDLLSDDGPIKPIATELAQLNQQINRPRPRASPPTTCSTAATCCSTSSPPTARCRSRPTRRSAPTASPPTRG